MEIVITSLGVIGTSLAALVAMGYKMARMLKNDGVSDVLSKQALDLIEAHKNRADEAIVYSEKLQVRINVVEQERNSLASKVGELTANVNHLTTEVSELTKTCLRLEDENKTLVSALEDQKHLMEVMVKMQDSFLEELRGIR